MSTIPITVFSDGAAKGNPGPGGWGSVIVGPDGGVTELGGREAHTTNNRMELTAAIEALAHVQPLAGPVALYTDSVYVIQGSREWIHAWRRNGWRTSDKKPVKNAELWQELLDATAPHRIEWHWVKGHSGHVENDRVDALACVEADRQRA